MFQIDQNKFERQKLTQHRWRHSDQYGATKPGCGVLEAVGGFGKTFTAVNLIMKPYLEKSPLNRVVVLLPRRSLIKQWHDEIDKWIDSGYHDRIEIAMVQTCVLNKRRIQTGLLIVDELHMLYGPETIKYLNGTMASWSFNLGLTATYKDDKHIWKQIEVLWPVIDHIPSKLALENNWISRFVEYNWPLVLPDHDVEEYMSYTNEMDRIMNKFDRNFDLIGDINSGKKNMFKDYIPGIVFAKKHAEQCGWYPGCSVNVDKEFNPSQLLNDAKTYFQLLHQRKHFLNTHPDKIMKTIEIIEKFPHLRLISFSQSTVFADNLAGELKRMNHPVAVYHSAIESRHMIDKNGQVITYKSGAKKGLPKMFGKTTLKKLAIEQIKSGEVKVISTASALDVGFDVKSMRIGVVSSRTRNRNIHKQRGYRTTRVDPYMPDAQCAIINLFFKMTQDETWLNAAQKDTDNKVIWINSVDEIDLADNDGFDL